MDRLNHGWLNSNTSGGFGWVRSEYRIGSVEMDIDGQRPGLCGDTIPKFGGLVPGPLGFGVSYGSLEMILGIH